MESTSVKMESTTRGHQILVSYVDNPSWYKDVYYYFNYVICILQFFGFGINLIHFSILTRPHMRSNGIYRLMIGICCCDLITQVNTFVIFTPFWLRTWKKEEDCYLTFNYFDAFMRLHGATLLDITSRAASWMALFMALYRTLSVMLPLSSKVQHLSKPIFALWTILGVLIFTSLTTYMIQARRIIKPYNWDYDCDGNQIQLPETRYGVLVPNEFALSQRAILSAYGIIKALPSLIDPIITIFLIIELRRASKRRMSVVGKCEDEKTTKLILFVTISFFFLEVPNGFSHFAAGIAPNNSAVKTIAVIITVFAEVFPIFNSSSHFFICLLMSAQYRETARRIYGRCLSKKLKVTMVEECRSTKTH